MFAITREIQDRFAQRHPSSHASSTSKGIANAFALSRELVERQTLSESLAKWQISELDRGHGLMSCGQELGGRSQGR